MQPNTMQSPIEYPKCTINHATHQCRATFNSTYFLADLEKTFPTIVPSDPPTLTEQNQASRNNMDRALAMASLLLGDCVDGKWMELFPIDEDRDVSVQLISAARALRRQIQPEEFGPLNAAVKVAMDLMSEAMKRAQTAPLPTTEPPAPTLQ